MRKQLFAVMFALATLLVLNAGRTHAQTQALRVHVPFDFSANNQTLPAGTYTVTPASDNRLMWRVEGVSQKSVVFVMGHSMGSVDAGNLGLTFRRYGDHYFLAALKIRSLQIDLPRSRDEKNLPPVLKLAKSDVVIEDSKKSTQDGNQR